MSVSLTSSGLYLEPRVYTDGSGVNYGTPKFVSSSTSLGGGSWTGLYNYSWTETLYGQTTRYYKMESESNVSSSKGGVFTSEYPDSISRKGGGLNADDRCRNRTLLFRLFEVISLWKCNLTERCPSRSLRRRFVHYKSLWKLSLSVFYEYLYSRKNRQQLRQCQVFYGNEVCLNPSFVKEVA